MQADEETSVTDIEIGADGRIYIFGASREVLELIRDLGFDDEHLRGRIEAMGRTEDTPAIDTQTHTENS